MKFGSPVAGSPRNNDTTGINAVIPINSRKPTNKLMANSLKYTLGSSFT